MAAVNYWLSQQASHERPKWRSQRPATPPSFHLRTPDDRDLDAVTWTRATTKSVTDYQGNVHQALSGEVTWEGYRRVRNLVSNSANFSTGWTNTRSTDAQSQTTDPFGGSLGAKLVSDSTASASHLISTTVATDAGAKYVVSVYAKAATISQIRLEAYSAANGSGVDAYFDLSSGSLVANAHGSNAALEDAGDGWYRCSVLSEAFTNATTTTFYIYLAVAGSATFTGDTGLYCYLDAFQCQRARPGQTAPDEYVSNGVLSTPYHGAKVDGVKYFATDDQGRLIDGTRGYDRDGSGAWVESSSVTPIATGLSIGSAQTNRITHSSDLTSGWTDSGAGTRTAAYDAQVGVYTQLRLVGASGVDDFYFAATGFTGSARTEPAMMLRAVSTSGSLVIENASDNTLGKWTVDLSLVSTTRFERIDRFHAAVTVNTEFTATAGGAAGIRFYVASGSVGFDVSLVTQVEGTLVDSLIYTAGSATTKNADYPLAVLPAGNAYTIVADYTYHAPTGVAEAGVFAANNSGSSDMLDARAEACYGVAGVGGVNQAVLSFNSAQKAGRFRVAVRGARDNFALIRTGNTLSTDVSGTAPAINQLQLGGLEKVTTYNLRGVLHSISVYPAALTDTQLQALSA